MQEIRYSRSFKFLKKLKQIQRGWNLNKLMISKIKEN